MDCECMMQQMIFFYFAIHISLSFYSSSFLNILVLPCSIISQVLQFPHVVCITCSDLISTLLKGFQDLAVVSDLIVYNFFNYFSEIWWLEGIIWPYMSDLCICFHPHCECFPVRQRLGCLFTCLWHNLLKILAISRF